MKLLIVESPGKIKKIQSILGDGWIVTASVGHIRDLPVKSLGVDTSTFVPTYDITKKDVMTKLKNLVSKCDEIYLATDPDREGEAIAWHLEDALKLKNPKRVTYSSITQKDVLEGISNARAIDMNLVKAQEARRVLDRLCGYLVSNPLGKIAGEKLSAGRVQSPAVRLVVERERAIQAFTPTTHYGVELLFENDFKILWNTDNFKDNHEYILDKELAEQIANITNVKATDFKEEEKRKAPFAPFTTSSLQQSASNTLKFAPKKTMELAQKLYEGGHITYMRTDSPNLSEEALQEIRAYCEKQGLPLVKTPRVWKSKENAQEAHEAIRPTYIENVSAGSNEEERILYELIRLRALASQLEDAVYCSQTALFESEYNGKIVCFEAKGNKLIFRGWKEIFNEDIALEEEAEDEIKSIPNFEIGSTLTAHKGNILTKKTQAPTRLTLATLVRELEKKGIGRPATYANILDNIMQKGYICEEKRKLHATALGEKLLDSMQGYFQFIEFGFTKIMEDGLDEIATGKSDYVSLVAKNYALLLEEIKKMEKEKGIPCPSCGAILKHIKTDKYDFFACDACQAKYNNNQGKPVKSIPKKQKLSTFTCPKCKKPLVEKPTKKGGIWFSCSGYPECIEKFWADDNNKPRYQG